MIQNTDYTAVRAIERTQLKQYDPTIREHFDPAKINEREYPFSGLYRLKNTFRKPFTECDPSANATPDEYTDKQWRSCMAAFSSTL